MLATASRLVVVTGTGTEIGKTHVACVLAMANRQQVCVVAIKPIESGCSDGAQSDSARLRAAGSNVEVPNPPYIFEAPVSPHIAARQSGVTIDLSRIVAYVAAARRIAPLVIVELAGGLWSPLGHQFSNVDVALELRPDALLLVVPDRLGAIHDAVATVVSASTRGLHFSAIAMVAPEKPDASTGTNGREVAEFTGVPVALDVPRATVDELARRDDFTRFIRRLVPYPPVDRARAGS